MRTTRHASQGLFDIERGTLTDTFRQIVLSSDHQLIIVRKEETHMKKKIFFMALTACLLVALTGYAADDLEPVPEIDFLTWVPAKFMAYYETSNYIAEEWRKLGLEVKLNQENMPNPLLTYWFKEHKFDAVVSVLSAKEAEVAWRPSPERDVVGYNLYRAGADGVVSRGASFRRGAPS